MQVVLLSGDLMVIARVAGAVEKVNATLVTTSNVAEALDAISAQAVPLLILDLSTANLNVTALVDSLQRVPAADTKILAFGPHVHEARLTAARVAGCDQVITRGQLDREIDHLLAEWL
jgi:CheY-like chemotaxis protein